MAFFRRIANLFSRSKINQDIHDELRSHIDMRIDDNIAAGMSPEAARRDALLKFGNPTVMRERATRMDAALGLDTLYRDVRYALRGFRKNPAFTITTILTLTFGIGATTAVFSVVDRILFRSLPYAHADRLVSVGLVAPIIPQEFMLGGSYYDWRDNQKPFEAFTSETGVNECDLTEHNPARLSCASVESNFLPTLGISPILGRNFLPEEDRPHGPKVALISYGLWLTRYSLDPNVLNKLIEIDDHPVRVIGVLPKDFEMPTLQAADVVLPQALDELVQRKADPGQVMYAFGRLKPGVSIEQASAELQPLFEYSLNLAPPAFRKEVHLRVRSIRDRQMQNVRLVAWILLGAAFAVLLIACANAASLLMTRAVSREREMAVRSALGATRGRLIRQMLTETCLLSLAGAAAGYALAEILLHLFIAIAPSGIPFLDKAHLDPRILSFNMLLALLCGALCGAGPALHRPRVIALAARSTNSGAQAFLRRSLVVGQIAISMVLLCSASLLLRSFWKLQLQDLGIQTQGVLTASISLPQYRYTTAQKQMQFFEQVETALRRLPGVSAVGLSDTTPPGGVPQDQIYSVIAIAGKPRPTADGTGGMVTWRWVTPAYFQSLGIPIVRGQGFTKEERTSSDHFLILSSLLASRMFANGNPIGQRVQPRPEDPWYAVVGVAANVKNAGLTDGADPEYYKLRRNFAEEWDSSEVAILKTTLSPQAITPWVRSQIAAIDPTVPVDVATLSQTIGKLADRPRFETALLGFFAFTGLLMAVIGLYGVISFMAKQRTQEIGVRMALGASRENILFLIGREGLRLIAIGGILGIVASLVLSRTLKSLLFNIAPHDPATFVSVALLLSVVALAATLIPARSATKVDPIVALRYE